MRYKNVNLCRFTPLRFLCWIEATLIFLAPLERVW